MSEHEFGPLGTWDTDNGGIVIGRRMELPARVAKGQGYTIHVQKDHCELHDVLAIIAPRMVKDGDQVIPKPRRKLAQKIIEWIESEERVILPATPKESAW